MQIILLLAALIAPVSAPRVEEKIFDCRLGAKSAVVTVEGDRLTYRYGTARKTDLTLGSWGSGTTVHAYTGRYVSILRQLRFTAGEYSYILYSMEANPRMDSSAISGLTVMQGKKIVSDRKCKPWAEFTGGFEAMDALPQDDDDWSAMAL